MTLTMALVYPSASLSHDSVTVSQHELHHETEAAKWNSAIINFNIYMCVFSAVSCQNVICGKHLFMDILSNYSGLIV